MQLSGLAKQDYLIQRVLQREVVVTGNPRVFKGLKKQMESIAGVLTRITDASGLDEGLLERIDRIKTILQDLKELGYRGQN